MANLIKRMTIRNFRSLADVDVEIGPLNVLFGPNGAGKSSFLDTIWFVRDCAIRSVELASSVRSHGIGLLFDGAADGDAISIALATEAAEYELKFGISSGRIEPYAGERLHSAHRNVGLIDRPVGSDKASFYHPNMHEQLPVTLREPEKLSMGRYLDFQEGVSEAADLDRILHFVHFYHSRSFRFDIIKQKGSEGSYESWLKGNGANLWSALRNLHDRKGRDDRYDTVMRFMARAFPSFDGLVLEATGLSSIYANFLEKGRRGEIKASGVSDGHLQMLLLLTALFGEGDRDSLLLLDEPEVSLHPWAIAVFAEAVRYATEEWNRQVFIATHSPVLLSQFPPEFVLAAIAQDGRTCLRRVSEIETVRDLLQEYSTGSLYVSEMLAAQSHPEPSIATDEQDREETCPSKPPSQ